MSERITELDAETVSQIAAGEVVERPASVVKELVENSIDAEASRIDVTVKGDGTDLLRVADDGVGMSEADLRAAVKQHTTSKIDDIEDLETGLGTLGFRGEALYTIGAVSRMTITSRPRDGDEVGTEIQVEGGEIVDVQPTGRPPGTTVEVRDLFSNTPARRKYLKQEATEFAHVNAIATRYALANPDVAISLDHDGREVFSTTGQGDLEGTILSVYGREVAEAMIPVSATPGGPVREIRGFVSDPETTRSSREYLSTFVNGRYVQAGLLREAVVEAYGNQLAADRFPFAVVFLEVPPETVDVNVHPRKLEVRFDDETGVATALSDAVEEALLDHGLLRTRAPRGQSAPEEAQIDPGSEPARHPDTEDASEPDSGSTEQLDSGDADLEADSEESADVPHLEERVKEADTIDRLDAEAESGEKHPDEAGETATDRSGTGTTGTGGSGPPSRPHPSAGSEQSGSEGPVPVPEASEGTEETPPSDAGPFHVSPAQAHLGEGGPELEFDTLPPLRVLGQVHDTYVVAESPAGLILVDQHAADERINYERLAAEFATRTPTAQRLVEPVRLELTPQEASVFEAALPDLQELGFEAHREGDAAVVEAVPAVFAEALEPALLREVLASFLDQSRGDVVEAAADALLADMACYPSITGGTSLREGDVLELLRALDDCENPYTCPHGRPVLIEVGEAELEARFERDYPGHQTRAPEE
ncbi:MAG: DNA mismatch repair endonuclease MutL [Halodesulfurarchaeum sp.]